MLRLGTSITLPRNVTNNKDTCDADLRESKPMKQSTGQDRPLFGIVAEFAEPEELVAAAREATEEGYDRVEAYSPFPMEELPEALAMRSTRLPFIVLMGAVLGGVGGFALQYWSSVEQYPLNVGGRPLNSWPLFVPVTFECIVLAASLFCVLGMLALNGLPRPHHPLFDSPGFDRASSDRFFLCIQARDARFDRRAVREFLESLNPLQVNDVEAAP